MTILEVAQLAIGELKKRKLCLNLCEQADQVMYASELRQEASFVLEDVIDTAHVRVHATFVPTAVLLRPEGYGEHCSADGFGYPVLLELFGGEPRLLVWADINQEDPTHVISLAGAAESLREQDGD